MKKISLAWYSFYGGRGYKGTQMEYIVPMLGKNLCKCYGLEFPKGTDKSRYLLEQMELSKVPGHVAAIVRHGSAIFHYPVHWQYVVGQHMTGWLFKNKLAKDESQIVYLNCMPSNLIKAAKHAGKFVVVEAGIMHPQYTYDEIEKEYEQYGIKKKYYYNDKKVVKEEIESLEYADRIITISKVAYDTFVQYGIPKEKLILIPMVATVENVTLPSAERPYAFICTATQCVLKGTHRLLEAWKKAEIKNMPLFIIGNLQDDLKEFVDKYGPYPNVQFWGQQDITKLYSQYRGVGILLSFSEGAVRCVPEYLSYGYPVIVSKAATSSIVQDGINGFIVDPRNEEEIIAKLRYFAEDTKRIDEYGRNALETSKSESIEKYSKGVAEYLIGLNKDI